MAKPPATVFLVTSLCRLRRAYATAVSVGMGSVDELRESLLKLRDRIDGLTAGSERMVISPMNKMNLRSLCSARKSLEEKAFRYFDHTAWMTQWLRGKFAPKSAGPRFIVRRSPGWVIAAGITASIFIGLLRRGTRFS